MKVSATTPPPKLPLRLHPLWAVHHKGPRRGWGWGSFSPFTFSDGNFFFFGYPDESLTTQKRFSNLTILNTPSKQRTDKLCLVAVANNENRKGNIGTFRESDLKMFR